MTTLPFKISGIYSGFAHLDGIARLEESAIVLEFSIKDAFVGVLRSQPKETRIPFSDLAEVMFKTRMFCGVLTLRARRLSVLAGIPGNNGSELRLRCRRRDSELAREIASKTNLQLMAEDLRKMINQNDRSRTLPGRTSAGSDAPT